MDNFNWVAVYGAALSTIIFARDWLKSKNRLRVTVAHGVDSERYHGVCAVIRVSNHGYRPLMLFHVGLLWEFRTITLRDRIKHLIRYRRFPRRLGWIRGSLPAREGGYGFPCAIEPLQSADFWVPFTAIDDESDETRNVIIASAQDALGRNSYSRPFTMRGVKVLEEIE